MPFTKNKFTQLPPDILADIMSHLEILDLTHLSVLSQTLRTVLSDSNLNPWRLPLSTLLACNTSPSVLASIAVYQQVIPPDNWIMILSRTDSQFLLYKCELPRLSENIWQAAFEARYLPSWKKWKRERMKWREAFLR